MKIYVGVDIAKSNHFAAKISSDGEITIGPFKLTNDVGGFHMRLFRLESFSRRHHQQSLVDGTLRRHRYLVVELYQMRVLNPIKTCQIRKKNIRITRRDKVDIFVIAKTLMMQDDFRLSDVEVMEL